MTKPQKHSAQRVHARASGMRAARLAGLRYVNDDEPGIARIWAGSGFRYTLPSGRPLKAKRDVERIAKLAIPPAYQDVWICRDADGHIQAVGRDDRGRKQYRYHPAWREYRDKNKFARMAEFAAVLPQLRAQVACDLAIEGLPKTKVVAAAIRLLDTTALRVGNDEYVKANKSFGVTTLRNAHANVNGNLITLRFRGKGGKDHEVDYKDKRIARIVSQCQELPGHRLFEFRSAEGAIERVTSTDVNDYLRTYTGAEFSAKDFRTWHASLEFALAASRSKTSADAVDAQSTTSSALASAAKKLGNTAAICRKCYVHPALMRALAHGRLPRFRARKPSHGVAKLSPEEAALQRFLRRENGLTR